MTENNLDIRWEQRFSNYRKALSMLRKAVEIIENEIESNEDLDDIDELLREGVIKRFEYTHELAWNVMGDYAKHQGFLDIKGSRDAIRYALKHGLVSDEEWMDSITDRNRTSHTYDENTAHEILEDIIHIYFPLFNLFEQKMEEIRSNYHQQSLF